MMIRRNLYGPYWPGVPSQYMVHYHPWPTRFHGPLYQRPVFSYPWMEQPHFVFKPGDFHPGELKPSELQGLGAMPRTRSDTWRQYGNNEAIQYDTGEGIFQPGGYGGGIFDGNLSGDKVARPLGTRQRRRKIKTKPMSGLGVVPWQCWDVPGFKACHDVQYKVAADTCGARGRAAGQESFEDCVKRLDSQLTEENCVTKMCPGGVVTGTTAPITTTTKNYPWRVYSEDTKQLQIETNAQLKSKGYCPLVVDGKLGGATCGARKTLQLQWPDTCQSFTTPIKPPCAGGGGVPPLTPQEQEALRAGMYGGGEDWMKYAAFGVGALAVLGIGYFMLQPKKKERG